MTAISFAANVQRVLGTTKEFFEMRAVPYTYEPCYTWVLYSKIRTCSAIGLHIRCDIKIRVCESEFNPNFSAFETGIYGNKRTVFIVRTVQCRIVGISESLSAGLDVIVLRRSAKLDTGVLSIKDASWTGVDKLARLSVQGRIPNVPLFLSNIK